MQAETGIGEGWGVPVRVERMGNLRHVHRCTNCFCVPLAVIVQPFSLNARIATAALLVIVIFAAGTK
jgi:hypothetical protein